MENKETIIIKEKPSMIKWIIIAIITIIILFTSCLVYFLSRPENKSDNNLPNQTVQDETNKDETNKDETVTQDEVDFELLFDGKNLEEFGILEIPYYMDTDELKPVTMTIEFDTEDTDVENIEVIYQTPDDINLVLSEKIGTNKYEVTVYTYGEYKFSLNIFKEDVTIVKTFSVISRISYQ